MADDTFKPRLGRIRNDGRGSVRYSRRVLNEAARNTLRPLRRKGHIDPNGLRRGLASGVVAATGSFTPGTRRVVVGARYVRQAKGDLGAARAHLRYIQRDGTTRDGDPGQLYDARGETHDAEAFLDRSGDDPHQFRFIVSIEDSAQIADLKPVIRDLMGQVEQDLGTTLEWVAVDHFNTGHLHTHIVVRGRDERGQDLVIARDYIGHGIRGPAQELVTLELGPETELERFAKRTSEIGQERLTGLDRALKARSPENVFVVGASESDPGNRRTQLVGRLKKLESLGLAQERRPGVWSLDIDLEPKLRRLGERADKIKMMQRALTEVGIERSPITFAVFDRGTRKVALVGKVIGTGLVDEISDRSWAVIDGADGRVHYVELGRLKRENIPPRDAIVRLVPDRLEGKPQSTPRIDILARSAVPGQAAHDGPIWVDRFVVDGAPDAQRHRGYGAELTQTIAARRDWLIQQGLGRNRADGGFEVRHSMLTELRMREISRIGRQIEQQTGMRHVPAQNGTEVRGMVSRTIDAPDARYAVITRGQEFHVVPWTKPLERYRSREIAGVMTAKQLMIGRALRRSGPER